MDTDPQPPLPCPLINTALPQSSNSPFQLRVPQVKLPKNGGFRTYFPLLSCPRGLSCRSTPSCPCSTTPRAEKPREQLPQAAPSAAAPKTRIREEQQPHQRGAPGLRRPQPRAAHGGCRAAPRPALLVPSDATARGKKSPGSCPRPPQVLMHQEPGSERGSSHTRGAHLASDGPSPQAPTGNVVLLHAPLCSCPATPPRKKSPGRCLRCFLVPLHQEPGSERSSSHTRGAHLASDDPQLQPTGALALLHAPLFEPSDAAARGT